MTLNELVVGDGDVHVVFLHGLFGHGRNWSTIARGISDVATSHLVDLPNHGRSPWTDELDLDEQAALIAAWLEQTFDEPVAVIGHSLGGNLAMRLALSRPELVERLMVVDIAPAPNPSVLRFGELVDAMRTLDLATLPTRFQADKQLTELIPDPGVRGFLLQNLRRDHGHWVWTCNLDLLGDSLAEVGSWNDVEGVYEGMVYWIAGGESDYIRDEHRDTMQRLFPKVISATLKGAGHWVHADAPEAFTATVRHFLAPDQ